MLAVFAMLFGVASAAAQEPAPSHWDRASAEALLTYIRQIDSHGLDPADYSPAELRSALVSGDAERLEKQATLSFGLVARDLAEGHLRPGQRGRYLIASDRIEPEHVAHLIDQAIGKRAVARVLDGLAPDHSQYRQLRTALGKLPAGADRAAIELNLERWRWLPRNLGQRHIMVNIPEYRLRLIESGREVSSHRVIVGKKNTPTPQFQAEVKGVIFNPSWYVPQSIIAESVGSLVRNRPQVARSRGYVWSWDSGRLRVTQTPGPQNALGQMKLDMPNPLSIFVHDTPSKDLFDREERTLSHGCIRTQDPFDLGAALLAGSEWDRARIDNAVGSRKTVRVPLDRPVPLYAVYITAVAQPDGTVRFLDDPYSLDTALRNRLAMKAGETTRLAELGHETECSQVST